MQLAETHPEMSFDTIQAELQIEENEVESFIIDGKNEKRNRQYRPVNLSQKKGGNLH